jgi:8-amino-7-oxononanoate synthase
MPAQKRTMIWQKPEHTPAPAKSQQESAPSKLRQLLEQQLDRRRERHQFRARRIMRILDATHLEIDAKRCVNFAANNYLGLTHHPQMIAIGGSMPHGAGSGAAGLVSGYTETHASAEASIAQWKSTQAAVLLPSGYQANLAAIQTFAALAAGTARGVRFLVDKLVHASLLDAVRGTELPFRIFPHNHLGKLARLLQESEDSVLQVVITESIFSMDGDAADLSGIARLKRSVPFALLVDEAHACGVYGDGGAGLLSELGFSELADVTVCTLSKAAGGVGGAVCASRLFCDGVVNFGRAYIYSTAVPPWVALLAETAIDIMQKEPWRQQRVRELALRVRARLAMEGVNLLPGNSPILPVILGEEQRTGRGTEVLLDAAMFVAAIRPPTVAPGTSRLRVTLSCDHTDGEIEHLVDSLIRISQSTAT